MEQALHNSKIKVLILDDDAIQLDIMMEYMEMCNVPNETKYFQNSVEMLEYIKDCPINFLPDVIFVDIFMPLMDGWETIKNLEPLIKSKEWIPSLFVITSSVSKIDTEKVKTQKSLKGFINKPIKLKKLRSILEDEYNEALTAK